MIFHHNKKYMKQLQINIFEFLTFNPVWWMMWHFLRLAQSVHSILCIIFPETSGFSDHCSTTSGSVYRELMER